jgi:transcriptional regulator with XRE-family HTH domain
MKCIREILPSILQRISDLKLTQEYLGQYLGLSQTSISRRLSGKTQFTFDELGKLSSLLGLQHWQEDTTSFPEGDYGLSLLQQSLGKLSDQDRREFLFVAAIVLESKLREPAKSQLCGSLRLLAKANAN